MPPGGGGRPTPAPARTARDQAENDTRGGRTACGPRLVLACVLAMALVVAPRCGGGSEPTSEAGPGAVEAPSPEARVTAWIEALDDPAQRDEAVAALGSAVGTDDRIVPANDDRHIR